MSKRLTKLIADGNVVVPGRPTWKSGNNTAFRFGALMLRMHFEWTVPKKHGPNDYDAAPNTLRGPKTSFERVNNLNFFVRNGFDEAGWKVVAFSQGRGQDDSTLVRAVQCNAAPTPAWVLGETFGLDLIRRQLGYASAVAGVPVVFKSVRDGHPEAVTDTNFPAGTALAFSYGGGNQSDACYINTAPANLSEVKKYHRYEFRQNWTGDGVPRGLAESLYLDYDGNSIRTNRDDQYPATYATFSRLGGHLTFGNRLMDTLGRAYYSNYQNIVDMFGIQGWTVGINDVGNGICTPAAPLGVGWQLASAAIGAGSSQALKFMCWNDDVQFVVHMWTAKQAADVLTAAIPSATGQTASAYAQARDYFLAHPNVALRTISWSEPTRWGDIYVRSQMADALNAGASSSDVDEYVVMDRSLAQWRTKCAAAPASAVWVGVTKIGASLPQASVSGVGTQSGGNGSVMWNLPPVVQGQQVGFDSTTCQGLYFSWYAATYKQAPPLSFASIDFEASLQAALDARGAGEEAVDSSSSTFRYEIDRATTEPWTRLGDCWFQHNTSGSILPIALALLQTEMEPVSSLVFPNTP